MTESIRVAVLAGATLTTGLVAGLFFAFSCAVMPGLAGTDDRTLVGAMQSINRRILNGWFLGAFLGAPLLLAVAAAAHLGRGGAVLFWTLAALACYLVTFGVTVRLNVPLNDRLEVAGPVDGIVDLAEARARFEAAWVRWNLVRTVSSVAAFACLVAALLTRSG
ncbi:anthrone oxygenase family protein [Micromonospora sp. CPCC 205561]|uniref:anthrone oxygenase family protein n=1 Tax=Micromonospora sp. CPCC 205561 TaxID=3122407 RepID=UPI002FF0CD70